MASVIIAEPVVSNNQLLETIENLKKDNDLLRKENILFRKILRNNGLLTEENYITEENIKKISLNSSTILECVIKHNNDIISSNKSKYQAILTDIWKSMNSHSKLLSNTTFNMRLTNDYENGYRWCKDLKIGFQSKDANGTFKEILNMIKLNKYQIYICIQLKNKEIVFFKT